MRKDIKTLILQNKESALKYADLILNKEDLSYEEFENLFLQYLCGKFMISHQEIYTDNFYEICQVSAEKACKLPKGLLDASELASKCGGATTAMNKKILFIMAVKREYHIDIIAEESALIETFSELKQLVYYKLMR